MSDSSVTTVVYHRVDKARVEEYCQWRQRMTEACKAFEGYQKTEFFEPGVVTHNDSEFVTVFMFESRELRDKWIDSDIRHSLVDEAEAFTVGKVKMAVFSGLEHWLGPGDKTPRYKMTVVTFFVIWPLVHFVPVQIGNLTGLEGLAGEFVSTLVIVLTMSYIALPLASRLFGFWLRK